MAHKIAGSKGGNQYGEYSVRYASEKQVSFIKKLLAQKKHELPDPDFANLNVQGASTIIDYLIKCENRDDVVTPPTEKQVSYATFLVKTKMNGTLVLQKLLEDKKVSQISELSSKDVSEIINKLKVAPELPIAITDVGAYHFNGEVVSVRKSDKNWFVWEWSNDENKWVKAPHKNFIVKQLTPADRLSLNEAIALSKQTGRCVHCGRTLTDVVSVSSGMGKWCWEKYEPKGN
jgi:Family of unknown function (DUF6011)